MQHVTHFQCHPVGGCQVCKLDGVERNLFYFLFFYFFILIFLFFYFYFLFIYLFLMDRALRQCCKPLKLINTMLNSTVCEFRAFTEH